MVSRILGPFCPHAMVNPESPYWKPELPPSQSWQLNFGPLQDFPSPSRPIRSFSRFYDTKSPRTTSQPSQHFPYERLSSSLSYLFENEIGWYCRSVVYSLPLLQSEQGFQVSLFQKDPHLLGSPPPSLASQAVCLGSLLYSNQCQFSAGHLVERQNWTRCLSGYCSAFSNGAHYSVCGAWMNFGLILSTYLSALFLRLIAHVIFPIGVLSLSVGLILHLSWQQLCGFIVYLSLMFLI